MIKRLAWFIPALILAVGLIAFIAACGGDNGTSSSNNSSGDKLSAQDYYKQLETLSQDVDKKSKDAQAKTPASQDPQDTKDYITGLLDTDISIIDDAVGKLGDLNPPDDVKPKHDAFVTAIKAELDAFKKLDDQLKAAAADQVTALLQGIDLTSISAAADTACAALQTDAKTKNITIDLKCNVAA